MLKSISSADANRDFSAMLRSVRNGHTFIVTSHGRPVARVAPVGTGEPLTRSGRAALFKRLKAAPVVDAGRWTRDELYEESR